MASPKASSPPSPPAFLEAPLRDSALLESTIKTLDVADGRRRIGPPVTKQRIKTFNRSATYESTRVLFADNATEGPYINATLLREPFLGFDESVLPRRWWIAAESPTLDTAHTYWSLFLSDLSSLASGDEVISPPQVIVQLNNQPYLPYGVGEFKVYAPLNSTARKVLVKVGKRDRESNCTITTLTVGWTDDGLTTQAGRTVTHFQYAAWPDGGVPRYLAEIQQIMKASFTLNETLMPPSQTPPPILVHCIAGIGRTGSYIALASLIPLLLVLNSHPPPTTSPSEKTEVEGGSIEAASRDYVAETIDGMRIQRPAMVERPEQFRWIYKSLLEIWPTLK